MTNIKEINYRDIKRRFYDNTSAPYAVSWFKDNFKNMDTMYCVLRNHCYHAIRDSKEIKIRDAFDDLLSFYSQLEIASIANFIPIQIPSPHKECAGNILNHNAVSKFYREYYPLLLPQLYIARLNGFFDFRYEQNNETIPLFIEMLEINRPFYEDPDVLSFLRCLDDYIIYEKSSNVIVSLGVIIDVIKDAKNYLERLGRVKNDRNALDKALQGFVKFLGISINYNLLLIRSSHFPLLQSAMWHDQSYWFGNLRGKAGKAIDEAIKQFLEWEQYLESGDAGFNETQESITELRRIFSELFSNKYEHLLIDYARELDILVKGF